MKKGILSIILSLLLIKTASAFDGFGGWGGGYYFSNLLQNPLVVFAIIFIISFAIIYYALGNSFKGHKGPAAVISIVLSLIMGVTFSQGNYLTGYLGYELGGIVTIIAVLLVIGLLLKATAGLFRLFGAGILLVLIWIFLGSTDPYSMFPPAVMSPFFIEAYETATGFTGLLIIIGLIHLIALARIVSDDSNDKLGKKYYKAMFKNYKPPKMVAAQVPGTE